MSTPRGQAWSQREVEQTVTDYFTMLRAELLGQHYSKTDHRRRLLPQLAGRSGQSVEFKHANISAVLIHAGLPYIDGYKPRGNYQSLLAQGVETFLQRNPGFFEQLAKAPVINPNRMPDLPAVPALRLFESPPDRIEVPQEAAEPWIERRGRRIDFAERDARNHKLGRLGEQFVVDLEKQRLAELGRDDLVGKVEWVANTRGDGLGFDVLSFDEKDDSELFVEVKTTGLGKFFPFYVSRNEVRCSEACPRQYNLYRVFDFSRAPRVYVLRGALPQVCRLEPMQFRAVI